MSSSREGRVHSLNAWLGLIVGVPAAIIGIPAGLVELQDWRERGRTPVDPPRVETESTRPTAQKAGDEQGTIETAPKEPWQPTGTLPGGEAPNRGGRSIGVPVVGASSPITTSTPRDAHLEAFLSLINPKAGAARGVAVSLRGSASGRLLSELDGRGLPVIRGFFRGGFVQSEYFNELLQGDGTYLGRSTALTAGSRALVGEAVAQFRNGEYDLVVCDLSFSYTVLDAEGNTRAQRSVSSTVPAYDRTTALHDAVTALLEQHGTAILSDAGY